jgi:hypothetical protein
MSKRRLGSAIAGIMAIGLIVGGCGGDDGSGTGTGTAAKPAQPPDLTRFLMRKNEEPGFRPGALPGATPRSVTTSTGVETVVKDLGLSPADARRLRSEGFISITLGPIRGPQQTAGVTNVALYATAAGARQSRAHDLRPAVIHSFGPVQNLRYFTVHGVPGARGWTASKPHVGNVLWVQGRCYLTLGNQGPGPFPGPLSQGVRAIYQRTDGLCP